MLMQTFDPRHFSKRAWRIKVRMAVLLTQWGLRAKFTRWRLTQDGQTGLVVLFGVLNTAAIPPARLGDYFTPSVLFALALELKVPVEASVSDGFRYAFILDRGRLDALPEPSQLVLGPLPPSEFTLSEAQQTAFPLFQPYFTQAPPLLSLTDTGARPTVLEQIAAEVAWRQTLGQPMPDEPHILKAPDAVPNRTTPRLHIHAMLAEWLDRL